MKEINNTLGMVCGRGLGERNDAIAIRVWTLFYLALDPGGLAQCPAHSRCSIRCVKQNKRKQSKVRVEAIFNQVVWEGHLKESIVNRDLKEVRE